MHKNLVWSSYDRSLLDAVAYRGFMAPTGHVDVFHHTRMNFFARKPVDEAVKAPTNPNSLVTPLSGWFISMNPWAVTPLPPIAKFWRRHRAFVSGFITLRFVGFHPLWISGLGKRLVDNIYINHEYASHTSISTNRNCFECSTLAWLFLFQYFFFFRTWNQHTENTTSYCS